MTEETVKKLENCARCGGTHLDLTFKLLTQPVHSDDDGGAAYTHWATCPTNGEPVLMKILQRDKNNRILFNERIFVGEIPPRKDEPIEPKPATLTGTLPKPPPVDRSAITTLHGTSIDELRKQHAEQPVGMHADYIVLTKEERAKGFVRPVRRSYQHVGTAGPEYPLRELTAEEHERYDKYSYYRYEAYPEDSAMSGRFWTKEQLDNVGKGCGAVTTMGRDLAETYARDPDHYGSTFCVRCNKHLPVGKGGEFVWEGEPDRVGT